MLDSSRVAMVGDLRKGLMGFSGSHCTFGASGACGI